MRGGREGSIVEVIVVVVVELYVCGVFEEREMWEKGESGWW